MKSGNNQEHNLKHDSIGFRIWIYFWCIVINIALATFMIVSKLIIIILYPFVRFSLFLRYLNLKIENAILKDKLKVLSETEDESSTHETSSKPNIKLSSE